MLIDNGARTIAQVLAPTNVDATSPTSEKFSGETPAQRAKHLELEFEQRRRRRKRGSPKTNKRIRELECLFTERYRGSVLPDDDSGLGDIFTMANHLAHFDAPDRRIFVWVRRWAPW